MFKLLISMKLKLLDSDSILILVRKSNDLYSVIKVNTNTYEPEIRL